MMLWWCVAMIINAFERQQEIKELYQDDAYTILHIIHEKIFTVGYKKGPAQLWMTFRVVICKKHLENPKDITRWQRFLWSRQDNYKMSIFHFWANLISSQPYEPSFHNQTSIPTAHIFGFIHVWPSVYSWIKWCCADIKERIKLLMYAYSGPLTSTKAALFCGSIKESPHQAHFLCARISN